MFYDPEGPRMFEDPERESYEEKHDDHSEFDDTSLLSTGDFEHEEGVI